MADIRHLLFQIIAGVADVGGQLVAAGEAAAPENPWILLGNRRSGDVKLTLISIRFTNRAQVFWA
jgi:hypothetical protein